MRIKMHSAFFITLVILGCATIDIGTSGELRTNIRLAVKRSGTYIRIPAGCSRIEVPPGVPGRRRPVGGYVCTPAFSIAKFEATVDEYRGCADARYCSVPLRHDPNLVFGSNGSYMCNYGSSYRLKHPVNCLTWSQAESYCAWQKARLPTEAEWIRAARGPTSRIYPWGDAKPTCAYTVISDSALVTTPLLKPSWMGINVFMQNQKSLRRYRSGCGTFSTWQVGQKSMDVSPFGVNDMAGNVSEWLSDCNDKEFSRFCPACTKDFDLSLKCNIRMLKGGSYNSNMRIKIDEKQDDWAVNNSPDKGVRCVSEQ